MSCGCKSESTNSIQGIGDYITTQNNDLKPSLGNISDTLAGVSVDFNFKTVLLMAGAFAGGWYLTKKKIIKW